MEIVKNKLFLAIVAGVAVFAGVYTGYIDISFLAGVFGGGSAPTQ